MTLKSLKKTNQKYLQTAELHPHSSKKADSVKISQKEALAPDMMDQHFFSGDIFHAFIAFSGSLCLCP